MLNGQWGELAMQNRARQRRMLEPTLVDNDGLMIRVASDIRRYRARFCNQPNSESCEQPALAAFLFNPIGDEHVRVAASFRVAV